MLKPIKQALKPTPLDMAQSVVGHAVKRSRAYALAKDKVAWPYRRFLVSHPMRFVYAPLPKVASGNLKRWMLQESGIAERDWDVDPRYGIHPFAHRVFRIAHASLAFEPSYFKVAFVRHPHRRLVSAFLDKLVLPYSGERPRWAENASGRPVLSWLTPRHGYRARTDVTFEDFLTHVVAAPDPVLDEHWLPQVRLLGDTDFDFIGRVERFDADFAEVRARIGSTTPFDIKKPRLPYEPTSSGYAGGASIAELLARPAFPRWTDFYRADTARRVTERYAADFERFGYEPHAPA